LNVTADTATEQATALAELRRRITERYAVPSIPRATWQMAATTIAMVASWALSNWALDTSPWLAVAFIVTTALLLIRLFIFQHDCGHGSFLPSQRAADIVGTFLSVITLTPYLYWKRTHAMHHAGSGNLERRGIGDINTMTTEEYQAASPASRLGYRLYRNPLLLLFVGAPFHFLVFHRWPSNVSKRDKRERRGVLLANLGLAAVVAGLCALVGVERFLLIQLPISFITCALGVGLFYVQHQFEDAYWEHDEEWEFERAGLAGSSYFRMPKVLQWFTGNIGIHHIHHLSSKIPNYRLDRCLRENAELQAVPTIGVFASVRCLFLKLWDEESRRLVSFRAARRLAVARSQ